MKKKGGRHARQHSGGNQPPHDPFANIPDEPQPTNTVTWHHAMPALYRFSKEFYRRHNTELVAVPPFGNSRGVWHLIQRYMGLRDIALTAMTCKSIAGELYLTESVWREWIVQTALTPDEAALLHRVLDFMFKRRHGVILARRRMDLLRKAKRMPPMYDPHNPFAPVCYPSVAFACPIGWDDLEDIGNNRRKCVVCEKTFKNITSPQEAHRFAMVQQSRRSNHKFSCFFQGRGEIMFELERTTKPYM
eukprot:PhF_6_TR27323/c0_g1_i1/m.40134